MNNNPLQKTFLIAIATVLILSFCGCSPAYSYNNIVVQNENIESEFKDEISLLYSSTIQTFKRQQLPTSIEEIVVKKNNFPFKKETGFSPHSYIVNCRINMAKFLLINTDYSVKEICFKCGFSCESSFSTTFKKYEKISPSNFRDNNTI